MRRVGQNQKVVLLFSVIGGILKETGAAEVQSARLFFAGSVCGIVKILLKIFRQAGGQKFFQIIQKEGLGIIPGKFFRCNKKIKFSGGNVVNQFSLADSILCT